MTLQKIMDELKNDLEEILLLMNNSKPGDLQWLQIELNIIQKKIRNFL